MIKTMPDRKIKGSMMALLVASVLWFLPTPSQAAEVTQLDITGGGVTSTGWGWVNTNPQMASLNIGGFATGSFNDTTNAFDLS